MAEHAASLHACLPCSHIVSLAVDSPFRLVQRSKPNAVGALTSRPQSRPSIHTRFPLKTIPIASWITSPCGIVAGDAHSLLLVFFTHKYFVAYLFYLSIVDI